MPRISKTDATPGDVERAALGLLARREHSTREIRSKLRARGFAADLINPVLAQLDARHLLSDERFAGSFARTRANKGYGGVRIAQELRMRGVAEELATAAVGEVNGEWRERITQVRCKKFGEALPQTADDRARQARFLLQRGFSSDQVRAVLRGKLDL